LIGSGSLPVAQAAARALLDDGEAVEAVVSAARERPGLFDSAVAALMEHRATAAGFAVARSLTAPSESERESALVEYAASLPPGELLEACAGEADLRWRERMLEAGLTASLLRSLEGAGEDGGAGGEGRGGSSPALAVVERLVETRRALDNPAGVAEVLERVPGWVSERPAMARALVESLVRLNRLDAAARADGVLGGSAVGAWLDGLRASVSMPHAGAVAERIQREFGGEMSAAEASALAEIESSLPSGAGEPPGADGAAGGGDGAAS
jgi:hypothetical protein